MKKKKRHCLDLDISILIGILTAISILKSVLYGSHIQVIYLQFKMGLGSILILNITTSIIKNFINEKKTYTPSKRYKSKQKQICD